jgi:hypothetical protein
MEHVKRAMGVLGALVVCAILVSVIAPKKVHAIVATLVEVNNPASSAVPTREVSGANEPFYALVCYATASSVCTPPDSFNVPTTTIDSKTVTRLVVEDVSGQCNTNGAGGNTVTGLQLETDTAVGTQNSTAYSTLGYYQQAFQIAQEPSVTIRGTSYQAFSQQTKLYYNPGATVFFSWTQASAVSTPISCTAYISGYLATP